MTLPRPETRAGRAPLAERLGLLALGAGAAAAGFAVPGGPALEAWHLATVTAAGFAVGSLLLLTIGHLLNETWLAPVRSETEAAARTLPLLALFALPLVIRAPEWLPPDGAGVPALLGRDALPLRAALVLGAWIATAFLVTNARNPRRASALAILVLVPTIDVASGDFVLAREPHLRSGLFPFAHAMSHLAAALAGAILLSLLRRERPEPRALESAERALLTLLLLASWTWFSQFLVAWVANLPGEAAWYGRRSGPTLPLLTLAALPAFALAVVALIPPGAGRRQMMGASALVLAGHLAHEAWLLRPASAAGPAFTGWDATVPLGLGLVWALWFRAAHRRRPERDPAPLSGSREGSAPARP